MAGGLRDELELDASQAFRQIDAVEAALGAAAKSFRVELAHALDVLRDPAVGKVTVTADTRSVTTSIDAAVAAADAGVLVTADAADVTGSIDAAVNAADATVDVDVDPARARAEVDDLLADLNDLYAEVEVDADTRLAAQQLDHLDELLNDLSAEARDALDLDASSARTAARAVGEIGDEAAEATRQVDRLDRETDAMSKSANKAGKEWNAVRNAVAAVGVAGVVRGVMAAVDAASDLAESGSKVNVVFGDSAPIIQEWGDTSATSVGLAKQQALEAAGTFGNLFTALGSTREEATALAPEVVQLGADLASFNNLGVDETLEKLRSGLVGEIEPLRSLGISFLDVNVKAKGMELGLAGANGEMTEGAKVQARWALITEQSRAAAGDFARTSDGLANQQRILTAELGNAAAEIGTALLPSILDLVQVARDDFIPDLIEMGEAAGPLLAAALRAGTPVLGGFVDTLVTLSPVLELVAGLLNAIPEPVLSIAVQMVVLNKALGPANRLIGDLRAQLQGGGGLRGLLSGTNLAAGAATLAVTLWFDQLARGRAIVAQEKDRIEGMTTALSKNETTVRALVRARVEEFAATTQGAEQMRRYGVGIDEATEALIRTNGASIALGESTAATGQALDYFNTGTRNSWEEMNLAAKAALDLAVANGEVGASTRDAAVAANTADDGVGKLTDTERNYVAALEDVRGRTDEQTAAMTGGSIAAVEHRSEMAKVAAATEAAGTAMADSLDSISAVDAFLLSTAGAGDAVVESFERAIPSAKDLAAIAAYTGIPVEELGKVLAEVREEVDDFASTAAEGADSVADALSNLNEEVTLDQFLANLRQNVDDAAAFYRNLNIIAVNGADDLARALLERGPAAAGAAAAAAGLAPDQLAERERGLEASKRQNTANIAEAERLANELFRVVDSGLKGAGADLYAEAYEVGKNLAKGMTAGVANLAEREAARQAAAYTARAMAEAARAELQVESPSKVGIEIGGYFVEGIALGVEQGGQLLATASTAAAEGLTDVWAEASAITAAESLEILQAVAGVADAERALSEARKEHGNASIEARIADLALGEARAEVNERMFEAVDATDAVTEAIARQEAEQRELADALDSTLNALDAVSGIRGAQRSARRAEQELAEARQRAARLPGEIADAERALSDARRQSMATTDEEALAILRAKESVRKAEENLATTRADATATADELEIATLEVEVAENRLTEAKEAAQAPTRDVIDAEKVLEELRKEQAESADRVREATDAVTDANLALVDAQRDLIQAGADLTGTQSEVEDYFRMIAEAAGLSRREVDDLVDAMREAGQLGRNADRTNGNGTGRLINTTTGRPAFTGPNGEGGSGAPRGVPGEKSWTMPDGTKVWYVPGQNIDPGNLGALGRVRSALPNVTPNVRTAPPVLNDRSVKSVRDGARIEVGGVVVNSPTDALMLLRDLEFYASAGRFD